MKYRKLGDSISKFESRSGRWLTYGSGSKRPRRALPRRASTWHQLLDRRTSRPGAAETFPRGALSAARDSYILATKLFSVTTPTRIVGGAGRKHSIRASGCRPIRRLTGHATIRTPSKDAKPESCSRNGKARYIGFRMAGGQDREGDRSPQERFTNFVSDTDNIPIGASRRRGDSLSRNGISQSLVAAARAC